jgi:hypothetical protein
MTYMSIQLAVSFMLLADISYARSFVVGTILYHGLLVRNGHRCYGPAEH